MATKGVNRALHTGKNRTTAGRPAHTVDVNVSDTERNVSLAAGAIVGLMGLARRDLAGLLIAGVGAALVHRGVTGSCAGYKALGINTAKGQTKKRGIHIEQAFLINKTPEELYTFWRNFENLPSFMTHLKSVQVIDERRSHWVATAPRIVGGEADWDAEITRDEPNRAIAWESLAGSEINTRGEIRFTPALGDRGTEVHVTMSYLPPAGRLGHWIATMVGEGPQRQIREDLRSFKRMMEIGEVPTTIGQPRGTCTGQGKYEGE
jgi:uncharacterized membrane protein